MNDRMKIATLFSIALLGCATAPLPAEQRTFVFVEQTGMKQRDSYNALISYLGKNLGDSNQAIKVQDSASGLIVTKISFDCPDLKVFMDILPHNAEYNLEIGTKDGRVRFAFEALDDLHMGGSSPTRRGMSRPEQISAAKACATRKKQELMAVLSGKKAENW